MSNKMTILLVLCIIGLINTSSEAYYRTYNGHSVFRVTIENQAQLKKLELLHSYDFWTDARIGEVDIMARPDQHLELFLKGHELKYKIIIPDVGRLVEKERTKNKAGNGKAMDWLNYHRIDTIHSFIDEIAASNPNLASVISIGTSTEGRDMKLIKIGSESNVTKPAIWIDGGIHAREWISPAITTWMINELLSNNEKYSELLNSIDFYILASANPDGYEFTHTETRLWRKTRSRTNSPLGCMGVDPNRNFEEAWGGEGSSSIFCSEIYRGENAFSEPETKAMRDFILDKTPDVDWQLYIAIHSYAQMILTPWGYTYDFPEDYDELKALGQIGADAITAVYGTQYQVGSVTELLSPGAGGSDDWAKGLGGFKYSYTIEVRDQGQNGFILPADQIIPTAIETFEGVKAMAQFLAN